MGFFFKWYKQINLNDMVLITGQYLNNLLNLGQTKGVVQLDTTKYIICLWWDTQAETVIMLNELIQINILFWHRILSTEISIGLPVVI